MDGLLQQGGPVSACVCPAAYWCVAGQRLWCHAGACLPPQCLAPAQSCFPLPDSLHAGWLCSPTCRRYVKLTVPTPAGAVVEVCEFQVSITMQPDAEQGNTTSNGSSSNSSSSGLSGGAIAGIVIGGLVALVLLALVLVYLRWRRRWMQHRQVAALPSKGSGEQSVDEEAGGGDPRGPPAAGDKDPEAAAASAVAAPGAAGAAFGLTVAEASKAAAAAGKTRGSKAHKVSEFELMSEFFRTVSARCAVLPCVRCAALLAAQNHLHCTAACVHLLCVLMYLACLWLLPPMPPQIRRSRRLPLTSRSSVDGFSGVQRGAFPMASAPLVEGTSTDLTKLPPGFTEGECGGWLWLWLSVCVVCLSG